MIAERLAMPHSACGDVSTRPDVEAITRQRTLRWFALVGLAWRILSLLLGGAGAINEGQLRVAPALPASGGVVLLANLVLFASLVRRPRTRLLESLAFFAADVLTAVGLNLLATSVIPAQSLYVPYHDIFGAYAAATVALWTGLRGLAVGAALCAGLGVLLPLGMAWMNGFMPASIDWSVAVDRWLWLLAAFVIAAVVGSLAREAAWKTATEGLRAGREAERARTLRDLHDTVLQTLEGLALRVAVADRPADQRLDEVRAIALQQANELRAALRADAERSGGSLAGSLKALTQEALAQGLHVELVTAELQAEPAAQVATALLGAVREALTNVAKHAGVPRAVVRAASSDGKVEVVVRDHGRGFDPNAATDRFGLAHSVIQRMREVGGDARVWSAPGRGTRVQLWGPR